MCMVLMGLSRFNRSLPKSRDYLRTGACDVTDTWRRCRRTSHRRRRTSRHHTDTVRFIAVSPHVQHAGDDDDDDDDEGSVGRPDDATVSQFNTLHVVVINVWILVDVLLLVRRLSLLVVAVRGMQIQSGHYDSMITWSSSVDQSQQLLAARQNGGPYCVPRPTSDDVIVADVASPSRDLGSPPEMVRVLGDVSLLYVALSVGTVCLLLAALCACAALLDHFLSTVARGSFLLPVSTYFRSAVEFLMSEARHLSAASVKAVEPSYELASLQTVIAVFNTGLTHLISASYFSSIYYNYFLLSSNF